jgi:hypothetical protein
VVTNPSLLVIPCEGHPSLDLLIEPVIRGLLGRGDNEASVVDELRGETGMACRSHDTTGGRGERGERALMNLGEII